MPSIRIFTTQQGFDAISTDPIILTQRQTSIENAIINKVAKSLSKKGNTVEPDQIEVLWFILQRSRNARMYGVELEFSEQYEVGDPGYKTSPKLRKKVRDEIALTLMNSNLPSGASFGVWLKGQLGATYVENTRP